MRNHEIKPILSKILKKIEKKDKSLFNQILNKIYEIISSDSLNHYKNLRYNLKESKRVHLGCFVLVFSYDEKKNLISFEDFDHHDNIYNN